METFKYSIRLLSLVLVTNILVVAPKNVSAYDIRGGVALELRSTTKTFNDGMTVELWVYCLAAVNTAGGCGAPQLGFPGPLLEMGAGQSATVTLAQNTLAQNVIILPPNEPEPGTIGAVAAYRGHTIHFAALDLPQVDDGVPNPFPPILNGNTDNTLDHTYTLGLGLNNPGHVGSHAYYCHVHQSKHLEMGEYGALIVRPVDANGNFVNLINEIVDPSSIYDGEAILVLSTIDPSYHVAGAFGDAAKLANGLATFAHYSPQYFLVNGNEGVSKSVPAYTVMVPAGTTSTKVAIRLIGMHSVNATFRIFDDNSMTPVAQDLVVHNVDGWAQQKTITQTSVELSPGQTKDIMITMPTVSGTIWYPEVTYTHLRDDVELAKVISAITIQ